MEDELEPNGTTGPGHPVRRPALLVAEAAVACAKAMFAERQGGPHSSGLPRLVRFPTIEEIQVAQEAVAATIGERAAACLVTPSIFGRFWPVTARW